MKDFCWGPWNGIYEGFVGKVAPCCQIPVLYETDSYEEAFEKWEHLRESYRNGIKPKECEVCQPEVYDFLNNDIGPSKKPIFFDLLFTNKCNFACLGCKPSLSSTINEKYIEPISIANEYSNFSQNFGRWNSGTSKKIDYIKKNADNIKAIHLNGGEPFIQDGIYELLEWLIKNKLNDKIKIWSHTNGSIIKYKGMDLVYDYLIHFKKSSVTISLDGFGIRGEYVRWGLNEDRWLEVYNRIKNANIPVVVQSCYNVFNALVLKDWVSWFDDNNIGAVNMTLWERPECYSAKMLNIDLNLKNDAKNQLKYLRPEWNKQLIINMLNEKVDNERMLKLKKAFYDSITYFDMIRDTDFKFTFPELKSLYKNET